MDFFLNYTFYWNRFKMNLIETLHFVDLIWSSTIKLYVYSKLHLKYMFVLSLVILLVALNIIYNSVRCKNFFFFIFLQNFSCLFGLFRWRREPTLGPSFGQTLKWFFPSYLPVLQIFASRFSPILFTCSFRSRFLGFVHLTTSCTFLLRTFLLRWYAEMRILRSIVS